MKTPESFLWVSVLICLSAFTACNSSSSEEFDAGAEMNMAAEAVSESIPEDTYDKDFEEDTGPPMEYYSDETIVAMAYIYRKGDPKTLDWDEVSISTISGLNKGIAIGEYVQVLPINPEARRTKLRVESVSLEESGEYWYDVQLENIKDSTYFNMRTPEDRSPEYPGNAAIIYPAEANATLLTPSELALISLPSNISASDVVAAVDFDLDGEAEFLMCEVCLKKDPDSDYCEISIPMHFKWVEGAWKCIYEPQSC
jgi:hypothetical protein